jgi:hypothetical protein
MAIYVVYRKVAETPESVEYRYGPAEDQLGTTVVIDPRRPTEMPRVGADEPLMPQVVRGVIKRQRATGAWPERGVVEH